MIAVLLQHIMNFLDVTQLTTCHCYLDPKVLISSYLFPWSHKYLSKNVHKTASSIRGQNALGAQQAILWLVLVWILQPMSAAKIERASLEDSFNMWLNYDNVRLNFWAASSWRPVPTLINRDETEGGLRNQKDMRKQLLRKVEEKVIRC